MRGEGNVFIGGSGSDEGSVTRRVGVSSPAGGAAQAAKETSVSVKKSKRIAIKPGCSE